MAHNVALFITCLTEQFYPQVGRAVVKVLEHFGCNVAFPPGQTCCGQPFYNNGYHDDAAELAGRMLPIFAGFDYIVTPSGSCCAMVRQQFPKLLPPSPALDHLVQRTYEFVEFLDKVLHVDFFDFKLPRRQSVTYHYNCHLRGLAIDQRPAQLIADMRNVEFRPMEQAEQCCGFGGTFAVKHPGLSTAIAQSKLQSAEASGATTAIVNDAGCALNMSGMAHRRGLVLNTRHVAEMIAEALMLR